MPKADTFEREGEGLEAVGFAVAPTLPAGGFPINPPVGAGGKAGLRPPNLLRPLGIMPSLTAILWILHSGVGLGRSRLLRGRLRLLINAGLDGRHGRRIRHLLG